MDLKQHQNHLTAQLSRSIEVVYSTFDTYPLKEFIEYCPHCIGKKDECHLHRAPLGELTPEDLGNYAFDAMSLWGDSADYRHFLPRILELSVSLNSELGFEPWLIGSKLAYAKWDSWLSLEKNAVLGFMESTWHIVLSHPPYDASMETSGPVWWSVEESLALPANSGINIAPFLEWWLPSDDLYPHLHLAELAIYQAPVFAKKNKLYLQVFENQTSINKLKDWLLNEDIYNSLMKTFEKEINSDWSDLLARGMDALEWMNQIKKRAL